jgi:hypothetical protein
MNEYDPKPKHVLPLDYGRPQSKYKQNSAAGFIAGIFAGFGTLIGIPVFLMTVSSNRNGEILLIGGVFLIGASIGARLMGFNSFARGVQFSILLLVAIAILLFGACSIMMMRH